MNTNLLDLNNDVLNIIGDEARKQRYINRHKKK